MNFVQPNLKENFIKHKFIFRVGDVSTGLSAVIFTSSSDSDTYTKHRHEQSDLWIVAIKVIIMDHNHHDSSWLKPKSLNSRITMICGKLGLTTKKHYI